MDVEDTLTELDLLEQVVVLYFKGLSDQQLINVAHDINDYCSKYYVDTGTLDIVGYHGFNYFEKSELDVLECVPVSMEEDEHDNS